LIGVGPVGAMIILPLLAVQSAFADIIMMADIARGIVMTQAQCAVIPQTVWINAMGRNICMRFYLSTAGGEGARPVVFLQGDLGFDRDPKTGTWLVPANLKDTNTDDLIKYADRISKQQHTTGIYLARMGRDGSSGWHRERHSVLEVQATNAALEAIKRRYSFEGFHVYGHSGGADLVGGLLTLRKDIGCAVPADGILAPNPVPKAPDPALQFFDSSAHVAAIAQNRSARILVVTDPQDMVVKSQNQLPFVDKLRKAGGQVEQFMVEASDDEHHFTTPHAELVMSDCLRGASHDEIAADLKKLDARLLAAKTRASANASVGAQDEPAPGVGVNRIGSPTRAATIPRPIKFEPLPPDRERTLQPKESFKECAMCPEMVVIPAGSFTMGSPETEPGRQNSESPQRQVTFAQPFAVGRFPVTFDEWDACVADGGCNGYQPGDQGWGRQRRPVINVSWNDAKAYLAWLSRRTGKTYRLLSEAEREYVTRAGTTTPFWWGPSISTSQANYNGQYIYGDGVNGEFRNQTLPVDTFAPNPWGLYQVHGNVYDWTEDCWHNTYTDASTDGTAWTAADCKQNVRRGGSIGSPPAILRAASRNWSRSGDRMPFIGFRVARTLNGAPPASSTNAGQ
jgi:formylglycine-generating enzyme required for sulfatase activity